MRHRFRIDHAVTFMERRQDERIGRSIRSRDVLRRTLPGEPDAPAKTKGADPSADGAHRGRIALERSNAAEAPIELANAREGLDEKLVAFARHEIGYAEQGSHLRAPWPGQARRFCRAGGDDRDPFRGDAVALDRSGSSTAWTEDAANLREQRRLKRSS